MMQGPPLKRNANRQLKSGETQTTGDNLGATSKQNTVNPRVYAIT